MNGIGNKERERERERERGRERDIRRDRLTYTQIDR